MSTRRALFWAVALGCTGLFLPTQRARADTASPVLAKYGDRVDQSINKALAYLARQQQKDGSFKCLIRGNTAVTSLCVMAFLAKGHTPGVGPYGHVIDKGIDYVMGQPQANGLLTRQGGSYAMYSHTISTLMLSEVSGMVSPERQERIDAALSKALKLILSAQKVRESPPTHQGGWRYQPTSKNADISCTGWALMSLRSSRNNGAAVPLGAIEQAVRFVMNCRMRDGGFAYQPGGGSGLARTGTGLLCLELCGRHRDAACVGAGKYVLSHLPRSYGASYFYYALYYCAQGMFQLGGSEWEKFATHMYEMMLKFQRPDGSWPQGGGGEARAGVSYSTAMGVLAISVSYRQLPIYQR